MKTPICQIALWLAIASICHAQSFLPSAERLIHLSATENPALSSLPHLPDDFWNSSSDTLTGRNRFLAEFSEQALSYSGPITDLAEWYRQFGAKGQQAKKAYTSSRNEAYLRTALVWYELQLSLVWPVFIRSPEGHELANAEVAASIERTMDLYFELYQKSPDPAILQSALAAVEKGRCLALKWKRSEQAALAEGLISEAVVRKYREEEALTGNGALPVRGESSSTGGSILPGQAWFSHRDAYLPAYRHHLERESRMNLSELQNLILNPSQCLIRFFEGQQHVYLFVIERQKADFLRVDIDHSYRALVRELSEAIIDYARTGNQKPVQTYLDRAYRLFELLFGKPGLHLSQRELILIPDGSLGVLPFEALLTNPVSSTDHFRQLPYLIRQCPVSYRYTLISFWEQDQQPRFSSSRLLALAPATTRVSLVRSAERESPVLESPRANQEEVANISRFFPVTQQIGNAAGFTYFKEHASDYPLIHLATHGSFNPDDGRLSFLAFSGEHGQEEKLYAKTIPSTSLHAELVVLSACESGLGNWADPAGPSGTAYGFAQAGAESTVSTLWKISDRASTEIMKYFYQNLSEGLPKDEALRRAKLAYLDAQPSRLAHPFYWAAFIATGDMEALATDAPQAINWAVLMLLFVVGLYFYTQRQKVTYATPQYRD